MSFTARSVLIVTAIALRAIALDFRASAAHRPWVCRKSSKWKRENLAAGRKRGKPAAAGPASRSEMRNPASAKLLHANYGPATLTAHWKLTTLPVAAALPLRHRPATTAAAAVDLARHRAVAVG